MLHPSSAPRFISPPICYICHVAQGLFSHLYNTSVQRYFPTYMLHPSSDPRFISTPTCYIHLVLSDVTSVQCYLMLHPSSAIWCYIESGVCLTLSLCHRLTSWSHHGCIGPLPCSLLFKFSVFLAWPLFFISIVFHWEAWITTILMFLAIACLTYANSIVWIMEKLLAAWTCLI